MRALLFILAAFAAAYAIVSGVSGFPINAGLGVAITMAAWLIADIVAYRQRERLRQARELVWARRERAQTTVTHTHERNDGIATLLDEGPHSLRRAELFRLW